MAQHRAARHAATRRRVLDPRDGSPAGRTTAPAAARSPGRRRWLRRAISAPVLIACALALAAGAAAGHPDATGRVLTGGAGLTSNLSALPTATTSGGLPGRGGAPARTAPQVGGALASSAADRRQWAVSRDAQRVAVAHADASTLQEVTLKAAAQHRAALAELAAGAKRQARLVAERAWQLPVTHGAYHLTSRFGDCSSLWSRCHTGLDFAAPEGTPIHAVARGTIKEVGWAGAYGNRTIMTTTDGTDLWYCHQSAVRVRTGEPVVAGQVIGNIGSTGNTTGPHVHLEVRPTPDHPVDPFAALVAHGLHP
ncbi:MAG TPA: M23 family metallopeptidase [Nocardioidaceae bacterium]|nr:M23 family metallopeptidase [Nocardioidaceae bacterium]